ncbi:MAG: mechanosensitive ion channel family protein [Candidatus Glassbacteria bacterium]
MDSKTNLIDSLTKINPEVQEKLIISLIIILFLWILRTIILKIVWRRTEDVRTRYRWRKTTTYLTVILGILFIGRVWFLGFKELATFLGLLSAGLAIALKDVVSNMAGWIFIIWRRPLEVGDRIQIGVHAGDVIDIRLFQFTVMEIGNWVNAEQSTGRVIHIPNALVFNEPLANYSKGFQYIWNEVPVLVTFESNWEKAKEVLSGIASRHAEHLSTAAEEKLKEATKKFMIFYTALTPTVYTSVEESGVLLTIRYLCEPRRRRGSEAAIWEDVLKEFSDCPDIDFAYPTQRFYNNLKEGKEGTRPRSID